MNNLNELSDAVSLLVSMIDLDVLQVSLYVTVVGVMALAVTTLSRTTEG